MLPLAGQTIDEDFHLPHPVTVVFVIFISTGLTAVIHRWQAVDPLKQLRKTQSRLLISETAASQGCLAAALAYELNTLLGAFNSTLDTLATVYEHQCQGKSPDPEPVRRAVVGLTNWGFFVAQRIVANHRGRIQIESQESKGTSASIYRTQAGTGGRSDIPKSVPPLRAGACTVTLVGLARVSILQVTALSNGGSCVIFSPMKFG